MHTFKKMFIIKSDQLLIACVAIYIFACFHSSPSTSIKPILWSEKTKSRSKENTGISDFVLSDKSSVTAIMFGDNQTQFESYQHYYTFDEQDEFLRRHGRDCAKENRDRSTHDAFSYLSKRSPSHAIELFKFCILQYELSKENITVAAFQHAESILLPKNELISMGRNVVVINSREKMAHGSFLVVKKNQSEVLEMMAQYIINNVESMEFDPFLPAKQLHNVIQEQTADRFSLWTQLELICDVDGVQYGCQVQQRLEDSGFTKSTILLTPHRYLPYHIISANSLKLDGETNQEIPWITTIKSRQTLNDRISSPNFFQILSSQDCLPTSRICEACMKDTRGGNCAKCHKFCGCFCDFLCKTDVANKAVTKVVKYKTPAYRRLNIVNRGGRRLGKLIPNIVHQTWFEPIGRGKYPNFSRLVESWKQADWDYVFYNDTDAEHFLSTHFPPEVKEAYDTLLPGAFKADLFRYCVLFVHGGVYADVDVLLESKLDMAIDDDVGFMIPLDSVPGKASGHRVCLWNGFMAAAPGHPFLATVIETVVNNIRNRFTSLDVMNTMCPGSDFVLMHRYDILFTTGPCILGASVNRFLGRHPQTSFESNATDLVSEENKNKIPGRVVILRANKTDMGCHRFTLVEKNMIIAATDMPDYDDRTTVDGHNTNNHYSKLRETGKVYGMSRLYKDQEVVGEAIKFEAV